MEQMVLGAMMMDAQAVTVGLDRLESGDFFHAANAKIFNAIASLVDKQQAVDLQTVRLELERKGELTKIGGIASLTDVADTVMSGGNITVHCDIVREKAVLRRLITFGQQLSDKCHNGAGDIDELLTQSRDALHQLSTVASARRELKLVNMSTVMPRDVEWIWYPFIPRGKVTILEGNEGAGKSTLSIAIASILTRGYRFPLVAEKMPENASLSVLEPSNVLFMADEDALADTVRRRLDENDADVSRVDTIKALTIRAHGREEDKEVSLEDVAELEDAIIKTGAVMVVVDPIQGYLGRSVDMNQVNHVRSVTKRIGAMAERTNCAIILIRHFRKQGGDARTKGMGSIDIRAQARSVLAVTPDPDDPNPDDPSTFVLTQTKHSLTPPGVAKSIGYQLSHEGFMWRGPVSHTFDELFGDKKRYEATTNLAVAKELLEDLLRNGRRAANEITKIADGEKIKRRTLQRAKSELKVKSMPCGGQWFWELPGDDTPSEAPDEFPPIPLEE